MSESRSVINMVKTHVCSLMDAELPEAFVYHNLRHTEEVVEISAELAKHENLSDEDTEIVQVAAWFHDLGHIYVMAQHELKSIELAERFLKDISYPPERIEKVKNCIRATILPQNPRNLAEMVICDSDLHHISTNKFQERSDLLRDELNALHDKQLSDKEWSSMSYEFINTHKYFTNYAKSNFDQGKQTNVNHLKKNLNL